MAGLCCGCLVLRSTDFRTVRQLSKSFEPLAGYGARRLTFPERSLKRDGYQFTPNHGSYEGAAHVSRAAESKNPVEGEAAFARHLPLSKSKADNIHVAALSQPLPAALRQVRAWVGWVESVCEPRRPRPRSTTEFRWLAGLYDMVRLAAARGGLGYHGT